MAFSSGAVIKAGTIQGWGRATPPDGWLLCDGSAVSRTLYAELFAAIGTTYGAGDGSTTFNLPNINNIVTDVNTYVPVNGNNLSLGLTNGTTTAGVVKTTDPQNQQVLSGAPGAYGSAVGQIASGLNWSSSNNILVGVTTDATKSGIVGTVMRTVRTLWFLVKY